MTTTTVPAKKASGWRQGFLLGGAVLVALLTFRVIDLATDRMAEERGRKQRSATLREYAAQTDRQIVDMQKGGGMTFDPNKAARSEVRIIEGVRFTGIENFTKYPDGPTLEEAVKFTQKHDPFPQGAQVALLETKREAQDQIRIRVRFDGLETGWRIHKGENGAWDKYMH